MDLNTIHQYLEISRSHKSKLIMDQFQKLLVTHLTDMINDLFLTLLHLMARLTWLLFRPDMTQR